MADHIVHRYDFNLVCAGFFKLLEDKSLFKRYHTFLNREFIYHKDESDEVSAFRRVIEISLALFHESGADSVSITELDSSILIKEPSIEKGNQIKGFFNEWRVRDSIQEKVNDAACFEKFLDYLKVVKLASISSAFSKQYQDGNINLAVQTMKHTIEEMSSLNIVKTDSFDGEGLMEFLSSQDSKYNERAVVLGNFILDDQIGGFEPQTLNLFISVTNGGKSMMAHHLVRQCLANRQHVYVACVEDRKRSFVYKSVAALTGIRQSRLKKDFKNLTRDELELIQAAQKLMKEYLKVDFIYGNNVEEVHKAALDYDLECENQNKAKPVVNIVDYTGHISSMSSGDKGFEKMRNAYAARKDFALKYNKICFDFAQVNRDGSKRLQEDKILTQSDLAGAFDLSQVCDNIISINRNSEDITQSRCRLHISKARDGAVGTTISVGTDFASARYVMDDCHVLHAPAEVLAQIKRLEEGVKQNG